MESLIPVINKLQERIQIDIKKLILITDGK